MAVTLSLSIRKRLSSQFLLDVAFDVASGVTIVFGESGSGKTTLLRCIAGLTSPDEGRIALGNRLLFDGNGAVNVDPSRRRLGFVFQHLALFPHLTAAENIAFGMAGLPVAERRARAGRLAAAFRIEHVLGRRPEQISGGERQRVGLARSLVTDPEVLLLDEPLSALDHGTQSRIMEDLRRWNEAHRIPILYVTHSQREVFALGERVVVMQEGVVIADGSPQAVLEAPSHDHVVQLAGFENVLDATVIRRRPEAGVMVCRVAGASVDFETPLSDVLEGRPVRVAIRAGDILVGSERPHGLSARNVMSGTVVSLTREGAVVRAAIDIGVRLEVHLTPTSSDELGLHPASVVWLVIKTHSCRLASSP